MAPPPLSGSQVKDVKREGDEFDAGRRAQEDHAAAVEPRAFDEVQACLAPGKYTLKVRMESDPTDAAARGRGRQTWNILGHTARLLGERTSQAPRGGQRQHA